MYTSDKEALILEYIYNNDSPKQRELAEKAGISLGLTNAIIKGLIEQGFLVIERSNSRNVRYRLTKEGEKAIRELRNRRFESTVGSIVSYKEKIESIVSDAAKQGYSMLTLNWDSQLGFIFEYECSRLGLKYLGLWNNVPRGNLFVVHEEQFRNLVIEG